MKNNFYTMSETWAILCFSCLLFLPSVGYGQTLPSFQEAMGRELQELKQTQKALQKTLKNLRQKNMVRSSALKGQVRSLMSLLEKLRKQSSDGEKKLSGLDRRWKTVREYKELLKGTLSVGTRTLQKELPKLRLEGSTTTQIKQLFAKGSSYLLQRSAVHKANETFFGLDGKMLRGQVVHVGEVAALGLAGTQGGVLMRLPDGALRLLPMRKGDYQAAQAMLSGKWLETVPVYLFDSLSKNRKAPKEKKSWSNIEAGGPIALLIVCLAAFGVLLLLERLWTLTFLSLGGERRWRKALESVFNQQWEMAGQRVKKMGFVSKALLVLLEHREENREVLEQRASEALLQKMPALERSNAILNVVVTVAPLLGLLGTVTGMISTFDVITVHGTGNPRLLSQGISEALITTKLGLAVAIPLLLAKSFFARWAAHLLEQSQLRLLQMLDVLFAKPKTDEEGDA